MSKVHLLLNETGILTIGDCLFVGDGTNHTVSCTYVFLFFFEPEPTFTCIVLDVTF